MPPKGKSQARSQLMAQKIAAGRHPSRFTQGSLLPENMEPLKIEAMAQRRQHGARQKRSPSPLPIKRISVPSQRALSMMDMLLGDDMNNDDDDNSEDDTSTSPRSISSSSSNKPSSSRRMSFTERQLYKQLEATKGKVRMYIH